VPRSGLLVGDGCVPMARHPVGHAAEHDIAVLA
jgi:hypothetical protein